MKTRPYKGATLARSLDFKVRRADGANVDLSIRMFEGRKSAGYRTDYQRVPARWLEVSWTVQGDTSRKRHRKCWCYTGKRYDLADQDWRAQVEQARAHEIGGGA